MNQQQNHDTLANGVLRTFADLLTHLQSQTPEKLQQKMAVLVDDEGMARNNIHFYVSEEDIYSDDGDTNCTLEQLKEQFPDEWETIIKNCRITPAGTLFIAVDWENLPNRPAGGNALVWKMGWF